MRLERGMDDGRLLESMMDASNIGSVGVIVEMRK